VTSSNEVPADLPANGDVSFASRILMKITSSSSSPPVTGTERARRDLASHHRQLLPAARHTQGSLKRQFRLRLRSRRRDPQLATLHARRECARMPFSLTHSRRRHRISRPVCRRRSARPTTNPQSPLTPSRPRQARHNCHNHIPLRLDRQALT
jgi:hypothetical protein